MIKYRGSVDRDRKKTGIKFSKAEINNNKKTGYISKTVFSYKNKGNIS